VRLHERFTDPRGIAACILTGAAGAVVIAAAGPAFPVALLSGAGIGTAVYTAYISAEWLADRRRPAEPAPATDTATGNPVPADTERWLRRATAAAAKLRAQRDGSDNSTLIQALREAASYVDTAIGQLRRRVDAVVVIDANTAGPDAGELRKDQARLEKEAEALAPGPLQSAKQASARAAAERARSRERLDELREVLLATLESTVLRLEAAADRGSVLVSLQAAGDAAGTPVDLTPLTTELDAVQAGLDKLEEITHGLLTQE